MLDDKRLHANIMQFVIVGFHRKIMIAEGLRLDAKAGGQYLQLDGCL
jgi:hypothetical protein